MGRVGSLIALLGSQVPAVGVSVTQHEFYRSRKLRRPEPAVLGERPTHVVDCYVTNDCKCISWVQPEAVSGGVRLGAAPLPRVAPVVPAAVASGVHIGLDKGKYIKGYNINETFPSNHLKVNPHGHVRVHGKVPPVVPPLPTLSVLSPLLAPTRAEVGDVLVVLVAKSSRVSSPPRLDFAFLHSNIQCSECIQPLLALLPFATNFVPSSV